VRNLGLGFPQCGSGFYLRWFENQAGCDTLPEIYQYNSPMSIRSNINRRKFIQQTIGAAALLSISPMVFKRGASLTAETATELSGISLPPLPYDYAALEPYIDTLTMQIHHDKHHAGYIKKLNDALSAWTGSQQYESLESLFAHLDEVPSEYATAIRNNGGGTWNHTLFWQCLTPIKGTQPSKDLGIAIDRDLGGIENLQQEFSSAAAKQFGSGWAWLCMDENKKLFISSTPNQDNPLMVSVVGKSGIPLLGLDVWEHAYYLHYQNRRTDYISAFWNIVNWDFVSERFASAI